MSAKRLQHHQAHQATRQDQVHPHFAPNCQLWDVSEGIRSDEHGQIMANQVVKSGLTGRRMGYYIYIFMDNSWIYPNQTRRFFRILHQWDMFHGFDYHRVLSKYAIKINPFQSSQTKACQIVNLGIIIGFTYVYLINCPRVFWFMAMQTSPYRVSGVETHWSHWGILITTPCWPAMVEKTTGSTGPPRLKI